MARNQVVRIQCDRCTRIEHVEVAGAEPGSSGPVFTAQFTDEFGDSIKCFFGDLCQPCARTVRNHLEQIGKKIDGPSPDREVKPKVAEDLLKDQEREKFVKDLGEKKRRQQGPYEVKPLTDGEVVLPGKRN